MDRSQILSLNDHLHTIEAGGDDREVDAVVLFFRMLEWMEIEGAIFKSYDDLVVSAVLFREEELEIVKKALEEVDRIVSQLMAGVFNGTNFACGVLNSLLVTYVFAAHPQHFWLLYLVEGLYLLPRNLYDRIHAKPMNRILSYFDYCWMMNTLALLSLLCLVLHSTVHMSLSDGTRQQLFILMIGTACGPLMGAAIALPFVALLFHNIDTMTGLFIHIFPPMVAFTLRWYPELVREAWSGVFKLDYLEQVHYFEGGGVSTVAGCTIAAYLFWLVPYTIWMLFIGLNLPRKDRVNAQGHMILPKYDTCFHITMRGGGCLAIGKKFRGRSKAESLRQMQLNHFEAKDLLIYMAVHSAMSLLAILFLGFVCYSSQVIHGSFLVFLAVICTRRGAKRYSYYTTSMYSQVLRKHFNVLTHAKSAKMVD